MNQNIYSDEMPSRIDPNTPNKEYPTELVITFYTIEKPSLGEFTTLVRRHLIKCTEQGISPSIILNLCFDIHLDTQVQSNYLYKFAGIKQYMLDMMQSNPGIKFTVMIRGVLYWPALTLIDWPADNILCMASKECIVSKKPNTGGTQTMYEELYEKFENIKRK